MKRCNKIRAQIGRIHSLESFGTHEGPGIRYLIFLQGCLARCLYCQNPDTWDMTIGKEMTAKEVYGRIEKCLPYLRSSNGGVTATGGEPLLQIRFLIELFELCKKASVHTAIDTSGFYYSKRSPKEFKDLLRLTDLFIVDIKAPNGTLHKKITSRDLEETFNFIEILEKNKKHFWIRYVLVPGLNDSKKDILGLKEIVSRLKYCKRVEFLPYHTLGKYKWEELGVRYPLRSFSEATSKDIDIAQKVYNNQN